MPFGDPQFFQELLDRAVRNALRGGRRGRAGGRGRPPARPRQPRAKQFKKKKEVLPAGIVEIPPPNYVMNFFNAAGDLTMEACSVHLSARFAEGQEASEGDTDFQWTHVVLMYPQHVAFDIRDNYPGVPNSQANTFDPLLPGGQEPAWQIVFAEKINRQTGWEGFRVYLDRKLPTWPEPNV